MQFKYDIAREFMLESRLSFKMQQDHVNNVLGAVIDTSKTVEEVMLRMNCRKL